MKTYEAEELGRKILALDPFDEEGHRFLMHCYVKSGEKAKAIAQYKRCHEIFKKGLNCEPSQETRKLYEEIMQR
jgi:DNA-binding SARP family transcriptional activator